MIVCITGIDGSGKGIQRELLADYLRSSRHTVYISKAYGDAEKECFSVFIEKWPQEAILFLFQALHVAQRRNAELALKRGEIVIADRWDESYLAYHKHHGILADDVVLRDKLNEIAFCNMRPNITFLLDIRAKKARLRLRSRGMDFFDKLPLHYHETMRQEYLEIAKQRGWIVLDGTAPIKTIHSIIVSAVKTFHKNTKKPSG